MSIKQVTNYGIKDPFQMRQIDFVAAFEAKTPHLILQI